MTTRSTMAIARWAALHRQGRDAWHRAGQRPPATLVGPVPAALHRGLEGPADGGRQHRPVRSLRRKRQNHRPHIYASLKPSFDNQGPFREPRALIVALETFSAARYKTS